MRKLFPIAVFLILLATPVNALSMGNVKTQVKDGGETPIEKIVETKETMLTDIQGHWAQSSIEKAVEKGYVSGYGDGTFRPNQEVTRAEFIRMLVDALNIPHSKAGSPWYQPYVTAALETGVLLETDFDYQDYTRQITRLELIRLAVRATELNDVENRSVEDIQIVRMATSTGILHGMSDGDLNLSGKTTRAQAIAFIERVIAVNAGQAIPVDDRAVEKATKLQSDPWGRIIRTTKLPKNADDYPYILVNIPNEMYEMGYDPRMFLPEIINSKQFHEEAKSYTKENIDKWLPGAEQWLNMQVNIDYRTIDYEWAETMTDLQNYFVKREYVLEDYKEYVDRVRDEKIKIVGRVKLEPSIMVDDNRMFMRSTIEFKIVESDTTFNIFNQWFQPKEGFIIGKWYRGFTDIQLDNMISIPDTLIDMRPSSAATTFFYNYQYTIED